MRRRTGSLGKIIQGFAVGLGGYSKKLSILTFSNIGAQIISTVGFIFITRIYSTASIGDYVTFMAAASILSILSTGNYEQALYIEKRPRLFNRLIILPLVISLIVALLSGAVLSLFDIDYAFYIAISIFSAGVLKTSISLNIASNRLVFTSLYLFAISPVLPLLIILNGKYLSPEVDSMIMLYALVTLVTSISFFIVSAKLPWEPSHIFSRFYWLQLLWLVKRYKKFLGFGMVGELIGTASLRIPIFIANEYFSKQYAAYYGIVFRMAVLPISLVLGNVSQIFMHQVSYNRKNNIPSLSLFIKYVSGLAFLASIGCIGVLLYGYDLIIFFLTDKYEIVSRLLIDFLPYIFMLTVITPLTSVLNIYEKQEYTFYNKIAFFVCSAVSFGYGAHVQDFFLAMQLFSISMVGIYCIVFLEVFIILYRDNVRIIINSENAHQRQLNN